MTDLRSTFHWMHRGTLGRHLVALALSIGCIFWLSACSGNEEDEGLGGTGPTQTPESLTLSGWSYYEYGDHPGALQLFERALGMAGAYGPAHLGAGWSRFMMATESSDFAAARDHFDSAIEAGEAGPGAHGGRACALLALGSDFDVAGSDAAAALAADPAFVFEHDDSFIARDLLLLAGLAASGEEDYAGALTSIDDLWLPDTDPADPDTWIVNGVHYSSFEECCLAVLMRLQG